MSITMIHNIHSSWSMFPSPWSYLFYTILHPLPLNLDCGKCYGGTSRHIYIIISGSINFFRHSLFSPPLNSNIFEELPLMYLRLRKYINTWMKRNKMAHVPLQGNSNIKVSDYITTCLCIITILNKVPELYCYTSRCILNAFLWLCIRFFIL